MDKTISTNHSSISHESSSQSRLRKATIDARSIVISPSPLSELCKRCFEVISKPSTAYEEEVRVPFLFDDFIESAKRCRICAVLHKHRLCEGAGLYRTQSWSLSYDTESKIFVLYAYSFGSGTSLESRYPMLEFLPAVEKDGGPAIELFEAYHGLEQSVLPIRPDVTNRTTSDEASFDQIHRWLHDCKTNHKLCHRECDKLVQPGFLPSRLIDIRGQPRLVDSHQIVKDYRRVRYATLSHRWQLGSKAKLLRSNLEASKQRIEARLLTPVFSDSIATARRLGLQYIWIDALCIIQDDDEDWRCESSLMGSVYANAFCNFGASAAAGPGLDRKAAESDCSSKGLFASRDPSDFPVAMCTIRWGGSSRLYYGYPHFVRAYLDDAPLLKRGWVLQERLLSPCSIYFGKQLTWECPELLATQIFPKGSPGVRSPCPWNSNAPVRLQNLLLQRKPEALTYADDIQIDELYRTWLNLMRTYRTCRLTFEKDVFSALSGLAKRFKAQLQDEYLAGLWRKDIIRGLLWHVHSWPCEKSEQDPSPTYKAPSWSWASPETHDITWDIVGDTTNTELERLLATVQEASVVLASDDPTGPVRDGYIRISGHLCANREFVANRHRAGRPFALLESYDSGWDEPWQPFDKQCRICQGTFFLVLSWKPAICIMSAKIRGLILEPTGRAPDEYRRVGAFNMDPSERREFVEFDPDNFDKRSVTII